MTKHLRLIMLSLLAMICMGGYAQVKSVTCTLALDATKCEPTDVTWKYSIGAERLDAQKGVQFVTTTAGAKLTGTFKETIQITKVIVNAAKSGKLNATNKTIKVFVGEKQLGSEFVVTPTSADYTFESKLGIQSDFIEINLLSDKSEKSHYVKTVTIEYKPASSQTPTTVTFTGLTGEGVSLINGKLDGKEFTGYTAVVADNVPGTIAYAASGDGVATVDKTTGEVTVDPNVSGTTKITATFTPNEEKTYAWSTASYTITNIKSKYYATVAHLRKDLNNGTLNANDEVAVKLTDAKVLYVNEWTAKGNEHTQYFVREGNAAISFYDTDIKMSKSAVVNGTFMGKIGSLTGLLVLTKNNNTNPADLQVKASTNPAEPIEISTDDIANYVCDLVTVKGATVIGGTDCALFNGNNLMPLYYNKFFPRTTSLEAPYDNANVDLTSAIVLTYVNDKKELVYELAPTDKYTLVYNLSEESVNTIAAKTDIAVSLKRTFYKDGEWNTLCLPFAVANAATAFDGAELREVDTEKSNGNTIVFKEATAIEAGKPYLIKWANSSAAAVNVEKKFKGVTLVAAATPVEVNNGGISFNGFYKMTEASELGASVAAIGAGNKLFKVTEGKMKGFRAAFVLSSGAEATKYNVVIDGTATGIEDLVIDGVKANGRVYNLNGQYVGNSLNGLQPGLYIQNGKKIVVK